MNPRPSYAIGTGLFILLGFAALAYLATQTTSVANGMASGNSYTLKARFQNIGQLKARAPVKIAGVRIGDVASITLEPQRMDALVVLSIDKQYNDIPDDSSAAIFTSGLLGDQYVGIEPGGSPTFDAPTDYTVRWTPAPTTAPARRTRRGVRRPGRSGRASGRCRRCARSSCSPAAGVRRGGRR